MKTLTLKVNDKVPQELDLIKDAEGLGNRTATFIFLIKYYLLTKSSSLDQSIALCNHFLDKIDFDSLPSLEEQLKDV
ncbi:MAG: hypothetical protein ABII07_02535 [Patescibacteria group bacterium]|nr:hypothetical protein [Patescibacteria group bacterium]